MLVVTGNTHTSSALDTHGETFDEHAAQDVNQNAEVPEVDNLVLSDHVSSAASLTGRTADAVLRPSSFRTPRTRRLAWRSSRSTS